MCYREENENIGKNAEERILSILDNCGEAELNPNHNGYPDITFDGIPISCKSISGIIKGNRKGRVKMSRTELNAMNTIYHGPVMDRGFLIVEIRTPNRVIIDFCYLILDWADVQEILSDTDAAVMTISFWDIINKGVNLRWWLEKYDADDAIVGSPNLKVSKEDTARSVGKKQ